MTHRGSAGPERHHGETQRGINLAAHHIQPIAPCPSGDESTIPTYLILSTIYCHSPSTACYCPTTVYRLPYHCSTGKPHVQAGKLEEITGSNRTIPLKP